MKLGRVSIAAATALVVLLGASNAWADALRADADALATNTPNGNELTANQPRGSTVAYDLSAYIAETGNATDDVFPAGASNSLVATIARSGVWLDASAGTPATFTFTGYQANQAGTIRVTVPCAAATGAIETATAVITAGASTNGKTLNPNSVTLTYQITATAPAVGDCVATPSDVAPTVVVDTPTSNAEGSALNLTATVSDDGVSPVTLLWTYAAGAAVDPGTTCAFGDATAEDTTFTCSDDGDFTVTLTATDAVGSGDDSAAAAVTNATPAVNSVAFATANVACSVSASLAYSWSDAGTNDTHSADINWGDGTTPTFVDPASSPKGHTYAAAGSHTASVTVTDDDGATSAAATANVRVNYNAGGGILQPINMTGDRSLFKYGSTIPVKIAIKDCDGTVASGLTPRITLDKLLPTPPPGVDEVVSTSAADTGNIMRFSDGIYIYNLATRPLPDPSATYKITITIQPGQSVTAEFGLKK
jgi:hypothetical protein